MREVGTKNAPLQCRRRQQVDAVEAQVADYGRTASNPKDLVGNGQGAVNGLRPDKSLLHKNQWPNKLVDVLNGTYIQR